MGYKTNKKLSPTDDAYGSPIIRCGSYATQIGSTHKSYPFSLSSPLHTSSLSRAVAPPHTMPPPPMPRTRSPYPTLHGGRCTSTAPRPRAPSRQTSPLPRARSYRTLRPNSTHHASFAWAPCLLRPSSAPMPPTRHARSPRVATLDLNFNQIFGTIPQSLALLSSHRRKPSMGAPLELPDFTRPKFERGDPL
jgi:hypothetical protein